MKLLINLFERISIRIGKWQDDRNLKRAIRRRILKQRIWEIER